MIVGALLEGIEEDERNELKNHAKFAIEEIPMRCEAWDREKLVRTMQPASKTICAFLNSGGGLLILGVDDKRIIQGLPMNNAQRDHFLLSLHDTLQRFNPPVSPDCIAIRFHDVDSTIMEQDLQLDDVDAGQAHWLRSSKCWCENGGNRGSSARRYVIMVQVISPSDGTIFQNEEGLSYRRRCSSNALWPIDRIRTVMRDSIEQKWSPRIDNAESAINKAETLSEWCVII